MSVGPWIARRVRPSQSTARTDVPGRGLPSYTQPPAVSVMP